jgi:hypothetical protein
MQEDRLLQMHVLQEKREIGEYHVSDYNSNLTSETADEYHECIILRITAGTRFVT